MDVDDLCMGCMAAREGAAVCPACGWDDTAAPSNPLMLAPGSVLGGQYLVGRHLGHGGFGIVYLAWDLNLELKLAIKEFMPDRHATRSADRTSVVPFSGASREFFEYGLTQFLEEGRKIARFNDHPGIVPVLNFFRENGTGYLVMSYVPGLTLDEHVRARGGRLPWQEAISITMPVMDTLRAVHEGKLLHRDISPDNIYISHSKQVKLLDFGAARQDFGNKSKSLILKTGFAPKEQYQTRGNQGPWTDVYALGATLYCLITGEIPPESLERNESDRLAPPSSFVELPPAVEQALLKALAIEPVARYQTIAELQAAIGPSSSWRAGGIGGAVEVVDRRRAPRIEEAKTEPRMAAWTGPVADVRPEVRPNPRIDPRPDPRIDPRPDRRVDPRLDPRRGADAPAASTDALEGLTSRLIGPAHKVVQMLARVHGSLSPAGDREAAWRQPAIIVTLIVGVLGVFWGLNVTFINANPVLLFAAPGIVVMALISGVVALVGNGLLLLGAYLSFKADARGPILIWATLWILLAYGVLSFALLAVNLARVADASVLPVLLSPALTALFWAVIQYGVILVLLAKRRA